MNHSLPYKNKILQYEYQRKKAKASLMYVYGSMLCILWGRTLILPTLKFYLDRIEKERRKIENYMVPDGLQGLVPAVFYIFFAIGGAVSGPLSNYFGRRPAILLCLLGMSIGFIGQGLAWNYWSLLIFRGFAGLFACIPGICQTYVNDVVEPTELSEYSSRIGLVWGITWGTGPLLATLAKQSVLWYSPKAELWSFRFGFIWAAFLTFSMFVISSFNLEESINMFDLENVDTRKKYKNKIQKKREFVKKILMTCIFTGSFLVDITFIVHSNIYPQIQGDPSLGLGWNSNHFAVIVSIWGISFTLIQLKYPFLEKKVGSTGSLCIANLCFLSSNLLTSFLIQYLKINVLPSVLLEIIIFSPLSIIHGIGYGIKETSLNNLFCEICMVDEVSLYLGLSCTAVCLGCAMSYPVMVFGQKFGLHQAIYFSTCLTAFGGILCLFGATRIISENNLKFGDSTLDWDSLVSEMKQTARPQKISNCFNHSREKESLDYFRNSSDLLNVDEKKLIPVINAFTSTPLTPMGIPFVSPLITLSTDLGSNIFSEMSKLDLNDDVV